MAEPSTSPTSLRDSLSSTLQKTGVALDDLLLSLAAAAADVDRSRFKGLDARKGVEWGRGVDHLK